MPTRAQLVIYKRNIASQGDLWRTAMIATDRAVRQAALQGILSPSVPEVDMLRTFFTQMRERERELIAQTDQAIRMAPNNVRVKTPIKTVIPKKLRR